MKVQEFIMAFILSVLGILLSVNVQAENEFAPQQKKAIEQIIHDYLVTNPEVMYEVSRALETKQRDEMMGAAQKAIDSNKQALFEADSPIAGNPKGDVTLVKFFDYQCVHCKTMAVAVKNLIDKDKQLRVVFKELPIYGGSSEFAAKAALAAKIQGKYLAFHTALMSEKSRLSKKIILSHAKTVGLDVKRLEKDMQSAALKKELNQNNKLARELKLVGTPAFIVAGKLDTKQSTTFYLPGAVGEETLKKVIDKARAE